MAYWDLPKYSAYAKCHLLDSLKVQLFIGAFLLQGNYTLSGLIGMELCRKTVGIIGTGSIGACAARIWHVSFVSCSPLGSDRCINCLRSQNFSVHSRPFGLQRVYHRLLDAGDTQMQGFGCRVIAFDIKKNPELEEKGLVEYLDMDEVLQSSDILSLHCPLMSKTFHMIDKDGWVSNHILPAFLHTSYTHHAEC